MLFVGMTATAGARHFRGVDGRAGIAHREHPMRAMAADALRDVRRSLAKLLAVSAGPVLSELVHGQIGVVPLHVGRVRVAFAAECGDIPDARGTDEPR